MDTTQKKREEIERFIDENFIPKIDDNGDNVTIVYEGRVGGIENGIVWMETAKKGWKTKPIQNKNKYVIVDADLTGVLEFLNRYYSLQEEDYALVRKILIEHSMESLEEYRWDEMDSLDQVLNNMIESLDGENIFEENE
jgi:hypothetical protein